MVQLAEIEVEISGDIGGVGVSRFRWQREDATPIAVADCNAAAAAVRALYGSVGVHFPNAITAAVQPQVKVFDVATGGIVNLLNITSLPTVVNGSGGVDYGAGLGARINWKTTSLHGRRFLRSATYMVPLANSVFTSVGAIDSAVAIGITADAGNYITALTTAALEPIAWHRPPKGTTTGGAAGLIIAAQVPVTPSGLRSRRS